MKWVIRSGGMGLILPFFFDFIPRVDGLCRRVSFSDSGQPRRRVQSSFQLVRRYRLLPLLAAHLSPTLALHRAFCFFLFSGREFARGFQAGVEAVDRVHEGAKRRYALGVIFPREALVYWGRDS